MPQLHCDVNDEIATRLQEKANQRHVSVSRYLALLIERDVGTEWPEGFFELAGSWAGEPLERPEQGEFERRASFD